MITYETLKELAHALSKITGYRYVAFRATNTTDLFIDFSNIKMKWYLSSDQYGFWVGNLRFERLILDLKDIPNLDWSKCQFDCKEAE